MADQLVTYEGFDDERLLLAVEGDCREFVPGTQVTHIRDKGSFGTVVAVSNTGVTVLWSKLDDPVVSFNKTFAAAMAAPISRRLNYSQVGKSLFSVQPLDETSGNN